MIDAGIIEMITPITLVITAVAMVVSVILYDARTQRKQKLKGTFFRIHREYCANLTSKEYPS